MSPKTSRVSSDLTFLTNEPGNSLRDRLAALLGHSRLLDWLVGSFYISGFFKLYPAQIRQRGHGGGYTILKDWLHPQRTAAYSVVVSWTEPRDSENLLWTCLTHRCRWHNLANIKDQAHDDREKWGLLPQAEDR
jgi:hypothetical protein